MNKSILVELEEKIAIFRNKFKKHPTYLVIGESLHTMLSVEFFKILSFSDLDMPVYLDTYNPTIGKAIKIVVKKKYDGMVLYRNKMSMIFDNIRKYLRKNK